MTQIAVEHTTATAGRTDRGLRSLPRLFSTGIGRAAVDAAERRAIPDVAIRAAVRARTRAKLRLEAAGTVEAHWDRRRALLADRAAGPVTTDTVEANVQHYEVPADFFGLMLGPRRKYSSALWAPGTATLAEAEEAMLSLTAARAGIADGQRILDLGCGWGSFTLWAAEHHPGSHVTALSNSHSQRRYIEQQAAAQGLTNVTVITGDVATTEFPGGLDRVVSVEMLEHVRNHRQVLARLAAALQPDGQALIHVFTHRTEAWMFDADNESDWMGRWFFSGGTMPSDDLLLHEQHDLVVEEHWRHSGVHYQRTLDAWLDQLDARRDEALAVLRDAGEPDPARQLQRWRMFLMASAEVWGLRRGSEFMVSHYLLRPR